jgi:hypothetical protein
VLVTEKVWHGEKEIWGREGGRRKGMSTDDEDFKKAEPEGRGAGPFYKRGRRRERVRDSERRSRGEFNSAGKSFCFRKNNMSRRCNSWGVGPPPTRRVACSAQMPPSPACTVPIYCL